MKSDLPTNLRYAPSHEWIQVKNGVGTVGLSNRAWEELAELVFLELPAVGRVLKREEACAVVESLKTVTEIYAPASGKVLEVNASAAKNPGSVCKDCYGAGWLFKLKLARPKEIDDLLTPAQYQNQLNH